MKRTKPTVAMLVEVLQSGGHIGQKNRIVSEALMRALGIYDERRGNGRGQELRALIEAAHAQGYPIASGRGKHVNGYWLATCPEDLAPTRKIFRDMELRGQRRVAVVESMMAELR
jgi:hypothetical protein